MSRSEERWRERAERQMQEHRSHLSAYEWFRSYPHESVWRNGGYDLTVWVGQVTVKVTDTSWEAGVRRLQEQVRELGLEKPPEPTPGHEPVFLSLGAAEDDTAAE